MCWNPRKFCDQAFFPCYFSCRYFWDIICFPGHVTCSFYWIWITVWISSEAINNILAVINTYFNSHKSLQNWTFLELWYQQLFLSFFQSWFRDEFGRWQGFVRMAALPEGSSKTGGGSGGGGSDSDGGIAKFSVSAEELKDVLECPVCLKVPRQPPIYQVITDPLSSDQHFHFTSREASWS